MQIKTVSPAAAFEALAEADDIVFIDIRTKAEAKEEGSPDVRSTGKKLVPIPLSKVPASPQRLMSGRNASCTVVVPQVAPMHSLVAA